MKAQGLRENMPVIVTGGPLEGEKGRVVDPTPVADGEPNQRKVSVKFDFGIHYILPRQIDIDMDVVCGTAQNVPQAAVATVTDGNVISAQFDGGDASPATPAGSRVITDPMDPALDMFRPDPSIVDDYICRVLPGGYDDVDYLLDLRESRDGNGYSPNIALVGDTQSGKTMLVEVLAVMAAERDGLPKPYPVFTINGSSGVSNYDLYGTYAPIIAADGTEVLVKLEGLVPMAARCGGFLYLDEWNAVPPSQAVALHPLLDDRRRFTNTKHPVSDGQGGWFPEVVQAHKNFWVISTINPTGYRGVQAMAEATSNRFRWLRWDYDEAVEKVIIPSLAVRDFAHILRLHRASGVLSTPVGTSALYRLNEDVITFGAENALWSFLGMFPTEDDRLVVEEAIENGTIMDRLDAEYPKET